MSKTNVNQLNNNNNNNNNNNDNNHKRDLLITFCNKLDTSTQVYKHFFVFVSTSIRYYACAQKISKTSKTKIDDNKNNNSNKMIAEGKWTTVENCPVLSALTAFS